MAYIERDSYCFFDMKIAFFHNLPPGGAKRVVYEEIKHLSRKHTIHLFQLESHHHDFLNFEKLPCKMHDYQFNLKSRFPKPFKRFSEDFQNFILLRRLHKKIAHDIDSLDFDIVIVHPDKFTQAPFLLRHLKTKTIYYCEELLRIGYESNFPIPENISLLNKYYEVITRRIRRSIDYKNTKSAAILLTNSLYTQKNIQSIYHLNSQVCYLGVDTDLFTMLPEYSQTVLFIGEQSIINGYPLLKSIENNLRQQGITVRVVNFFDKQNKISDIQLAKLYAQSLATLCLSLSEPFGLTAIESMACGTPVIAVNEGGYTESVINNQTGYLIKRDPNQLFEKIILLSKNRQLRKSLGLASRKHILSRWTWNDHTKHLESFF